MAIVYRVIRRKYAAKPLDIAGTRLNGGRWNPAGIGILYTAEHPALALLEILVHMPRLPYAELPEYRLFKLYIPDSQRILLADELPDFWNDKTYAKSQFILSDWLSNPDVLALGVPSSVLTTGINYLLHPEHPTFADIQIIDDKPLIIDTRLWPL